MRGNIDGVNGFENMKLAWTAILALLFRVQSAGDVITLTNGSRIECNIRHVSPTELTAAPQNSPIQTSDVLRFHLSEIRDVSLSQSSTDAIKAAATEETLAKLKEMWTTMHPLIVKPGTELAEAGLRLAEEAIAKNPFSVTTEEAFAIVRFVKTAGTQDSHKIQAAGLEMRILAELGRFEEARMEYQKWEDARAPLPPRVSARLAAGLCGHEEMRLFIFENPRWQEDLRVHRERSEIYERTLDAYMFAALFGDTQNGVAQAALYHAAKFMTLCGEQSEAIGIAGTLRGRFPDSSYAKKIEQEIRAAGESHPPNPHSARLPACNP